MQRISKWGLLLMVAVVLAGCAPLAPIQNVKDASVTADQAADARIR